MVGAVYVVTGTVSRGEVVASSFSNGRVRSPTVLGSIRHRRRVSMDVVLNADGRDLRVRLEDRREEKIKNKRIDARVSV